MSPVHQVWPKKKKHLARYSEREEKTRPKKEVGGQHLGMDRPGVCQILEGSGEQRKMQETGSEVICGAPTTPAVKGYVMVKAKKQTLLRSLGLGHDRTLSS